MPRASRRDLFKALMAGAAASPFSPASAASPGCTNNVFGGFLSLRPAIYSVGPGKVRLRDFTYRAIEGTRA